MHVESLRSRGGALLVVCIGLLLTASCAAEPVQPPPPGRQELYDFTSLEEMVATSDAVIEGTVLSAEPGRVVGSDSDPVQFVQLNLKVDELLFGKLPVLGKDQTIMLEESAGSVEGSGDLQGVYGSAAGDHGIYFLGWKDETPFYYLINSEGRFLVQDGKVVALNKLDEWALDLERLSPDALKSRILEAADAARAGEVAPVAPGLDY